MTDTAAARPGGTSRPAGRATDAAVPDRAPVENRTLWVGDNLQVLRSLPDGAADLVYADPPFNTGRRWNGAAGSPDELAGFDGVWSQVDRGDLRALAAGGHQTAADVAEACGLAGGDRMRAYLVYMAVRLAEMRRVLAPTGSLWVHSDDTAGAYLRVVLDAVFGPSGYRNTVVWKRTTSHNSATRQMGRVADHLLWYTKTGRYKWRQQYHPRTAADLAEYRHQDDDGRWYKCDDLTAPASGGPGDDTRRFEWRGARPPQTRKWITDPVGLEAMLADGLIDLGGGGDGRMRGRRRYLDEAAPGQKLQNIWADIDRVGSTAAERTGWPTQKPVSLLERIVDAVTDPGDLVVAPFCGSGTACAAAERLGRRWAGIDSDRAALAVTVERLSAESSAGNGDVDDMGTGQFPGFDYDRTAGRWEAPKVTVVET